MAENDISSSQTRRDDAGAPLNGGKDGQPWQQWLETAGAALLLALPLLWLHLVPDGETHYHELLPMNAVYQGLLIDFIAVVLVCRLVLWLLQKWHSPLRNLLWLLVIALLVVRLTRTLVVATWVSPRSAQSGRIFLVVAGAGFALWLVRRSWYRGAVRGARWILILVGFSIFWVLPELVVMAFRAEPRETSGFSRPVKEPQRRIVWLLFDEASYDQLFDHRQPGMSFPSFDALAHTSTLFSNVRPSGYYTELVIPSLLQGEVVTQEESDLKGRLFVKTNEHRHWRLYPDDQSLFATAHDEGWSTGAVGWYNPYCRIFARELDDCYWTLTIPLPGHYWPNRSPWQNAIAPLGRSFLRAVGAQQPPSPPAWKMHTDDYNEVLAHARDEIAGDRIGFLFIHLPVPHPGGIYNRKTRQIGVDGSYLDNLVLADETLQELMEDIRKSALGDRTTIIVSSDHSWRIALWRPTTDWRPEDARVSGGHFDPRPVLMVHVPGEDQEVTISRPFPLIEMHGMVEQMLAGRIENSTALQNWVVRTASGTH